MTTKDSNKLISEFMGAVVMETYLNPEKEVDHYLMNMGKDRLVNSRYIANTTMEYHTSFDWLMPVVENIEKLANLKDDQFYYSTGVGFHHIEKTDYADDKCPYWVALTNDEDVGGIESPKIYKSYYSFGINKVGLHSINEGLVASGQNEDRLTAIYEGVVMFVNLYLTRKFNDSLTES